jgi:membrane protease subunit HflC
LIRAKADRKARVIVAEARGKAEVTRGDGDAQAARIYAESYNLDPDFYAFVRSLEAYQKTIGVGTTVVLSPDSEFFQYLGGWRGPTPRAQTPAARTPGSRPEKERTPGSVQP